MLPAGALPRGLSRLQAAEYVGLSPAKFDELVKEGKMPSPKRVGSRVLWDRLKVDEAFNALPGDEEANPWDSVIG